PAPRTISRGFGCGLEKSPKGIKFPRGKYAEGLAAPPQPTTLAIKQPWQISCVAYSQSPMPPRPLAHTARGVGVVGCSALGRASGSLSAPLPILAWACSQLWELTRHRRSLVDEADHIGQGKCQVGTE